MTSTASISIWLAVGAGLLSFVSPCTLPLFPSYLGYISGVSFHNLQSGNPIPREVRVRAFFHALLFTLGLSFLFVLLGMSATAFGNYLKDYKLYVRMVGGILVIAMGLFMTGMFKSEFLLKERRFHLPAKKPLGYFGTFLIGVAFATGWTPCVGPILASVLAMVVSNPSIGAWYMAAYAAGFAIPFLILAITLTSIRPLLRYTELIAKIGGWVMVVMGFMLLSGKLGAIAQWLQQITGYTGY